MKLRLVPIPNFSNRYYADEAGNIYSAKTGKVMSFRDNGRGYDMVTLRDENNKKVHYKIHRLIASLFIKNENNYPYINHIDGNKKNNRVTNLEWCTAKQNTQHAIKLGLFQGRPARAIDEVGYIGENLMTGTTIAFNTITDAEKAGYDNSTIIKCCKGKRNTHKGFKWSYANCRRAA